MGLARLATAEVSGCLRILHCCQLSPTLVCTTNLHRFAQGLVDLYSTHFIAQYADGASDDYRTARLAQAYESARFVTSTRKAPLCLFAGDLNCTPDSDEFLLLATLTGFADTYSGSTHSALHNGALAPHSPTNTGEPQRHIADATYGAPNNTYAAEDASGCCPAPQCDINCRLDYILFHSPGAGGNALVSMQESQCSACKPAESTSWSVQSSGFDCEEEVVLPGGRRSTLSDHTAVWTVFASCPEAPPAHSGGGRQRGPHLPTESVALTHGYATQPAGRSSTPVAVGMQMAAHGTELFSYAPRNVTHLQHKVLKDALGTFRIAATAAAEKSRSEGRTAWVMAFLACLVMLLVAADFLGIDERGWAETPRDSLLQFAAGAFVPWLVMICLALSHSCLIIGPRPRPMLVAIVLFGLTMVGGVAASIWVAGGLALAGLVVGCCAVGAAVSIISAHYLTAQKRRAFHMLSVHIQVTLSHSDSTVNVQSSDFSSRPSRGVRGNSSANSLLVGPVSSGENGSPEPKVPSLRDMRLSMAAMPPKRV